MSTRLLIVLCAAVAATLACGSANDPSASCGSSGATAVINATGANTFSPNTATIAAGQSVCWQNNSGVAHTVTSDDGTSFNSALAAGKIFTQTFGTPGTYQYHCSIHNGMTGSVTVN